MQGEEMKILVACECSGRVRDAFIAKGHDAISCDILPSDSPGPHIQDDVRNIIGYGNTWDMMIAFPPCTYLCSSGLHWNKKRPEREALTKQAIEFVEILINAPIFKIAIENPVGCISTKIEKPTQYIQPYDFGEDASKKTCLWLQWIPKLIKTHYIQPRIVNGKKRWSNQTDSGQNKLGPSETRGADRAITYQGIANAMAEQWG
jgi:hypothetical protein